MDERIYSLETEYALTHLLPPGQPAVPLERIMDLIFDTLDPKLKDPSAKGNLIYLVNGAKFYDDSGHPEWSAPECRSASDAVLWDKAGERILAELGEVVESVSGGEILIVKNNVDGAGHFYGCHENYLIERKPAFVNSEEDFLRLLVRQLVPFLITRQIYTGAGKVGWLQSAKEPTFGYQISQRAEVMQRIVSEETRNERGIINLRDEALANQLKYRRLHLIIGDSNLSEWANLMKLGTTGIILRLIEDHFIDQDLVLTDPLKAVREISYDPTCRRPVELKDGRLMTAVEIQAVYLEMAEEYFKAVTPDDETRFILDEWKEALNELSNDPRHLANRVDWVIKRDLLEQQMERQGLDWQAPEIRELDFKYHNINLQRGLFYQLQQIGLVRTLLEPIQIEEAKKQPPWDTRAKIRSDAIRAVQRWRMPLEVEWERVKLDNHSFLLDEPLEFFHAEIDTLLADGRTLSFLNEMIAHDNPAVRRQAVKALGQLEGNEPMEMLGKALLDPYWMVRAAVIDVFSSKPAELVEDLIKQALYDDYFVVRCRAAEALRQIR